MGNINLRFYAWMLVRRLPYLFLIAAFTTVAACYVAFSLTPLYRAVAKILVASPRISVEMARSSVPADAIEQVQVMQQHLMTRASLLAMADRFGIYRDESRITDAAIVADMQDRTRVEPLRLDTPPGSEGALVYAISFDAPDPDLAAEVANAYVDSMLQESARFRKERAAETSRFMQQEADRLSEALKSVDEEIARFKSEHAGALPESLELRRAQQSSIQERLLTLERQEASLRSRRSTLEKIYADTSSVGQGAEATPEDQMILNLRRLLVEQQAIFAESSPNIRALRARIASLEEEARAKRVASIQEPGLEQMPRDLQLQLADIDGQLEFATQEKAALQQRLDSLTQSIGATAENAAVLSRLEREYQNAEAQYRVASSKLADASTGEHIEEQAIGEKLTLIEAAAPPLKPISPNKRAIVALGAVIGIALGGILVLMVEIWKAPVRRASDIERLFQGQPLVTVPYIYHPGESVLSSVAPSLAVISGILVLIYGWHIARPEDVQMVINALSETFRIGGKVRGV